MFLHIVFVDLSLSYNNPCPGKLPCLLYIIYSMSHKSNGYYV